MKVVVKRGSIQKSRIENVDASNANDIKDGKEKSITEIFCMRAEEETLFLHSPFLNLKFKFNST